MIPEWLKALLLTGWVVCWATTVWGLDCYRCHEQGGFQGQVVHAPVAKNECWVCHNPHVAEHKGLLRIAQAELCYGCHQDFARQLERGQFQHRPVQQGQCVACHQPHAADAAGLLISSTKDLCTLCHDQVLTEYRYLHDPFQQGRCNVCHTPHASEDPRLLRQTTTQLCFACHAPTDRWSSVHLGRDFAQLDCLNCHHPHGSSSKVLLRAIQHRPFAEQNCQACHNDKQGAGLCLSCHSESLSSFNVVHSHRGVGGFQRACIVCHNPHVGDRPGLLPNNEGRICQPCHSDTFKKRQQALHTHPGWNHCSDCHLGHGANDPAMLKQGADLCHQCHDQHKVFSHPLGEAALDPRNNRPMDCMTCHAVNSGTMYQHFLRGSGERGLCVQCHQSY